MNRKTVISIILVMVTVITVALISSSSPASGNYYTVAQLRASEKLYDSATLIHTHELSDKYVDFIIDKDDNYCVVEINKKTTLFGQRYVMGTWSSKPIGDALSEDVSSYIATGVLDFTSLPHFGHQSEAVLYHCFAPDGISAEDENITTVAFTYQGEQYLLCTKLEAQ